jgi:hypothetical protein
MRIAFLSPSLSPLFFVMLAGACSDRFAATEPGLDADAGDAGADVSAAVDAASELDEHHAAAAECDTFGRTGEGDTCRLFAYCGHGEFDVDCSARFTCICSQPEVDGGATKQIAAQPIFCESAANDLKSAFAAAHQACGW